MPVRPERRHYLRAYHCMLFGLAVRLRCWLAREECLAVCRACLWRGFEMYLRVKLALWLLSSRPLPGCGACAPHFVDGSFPLPRLILSRRTNFEMSETNAPRVQATCRDDARCEGVKEVHQMLKKSDRASTAVCLRMPSSTTFAAAFAGKDSLRVCICSLFM